MTIEQLISQLTKYAPERRVVVRGNDSRCVDIDGVYEVLPNGLIKITLEEC